MALAEEEVLAMTADIVGKILSGDAHYVLSNQKDVCELIQAVYDKLRQINDTIG